jgi:hypothetical protein
MKEFRTRKNEPTFFDLIDSYFPEPYRTIYSDPLKICKTLQVACSFTNKESCLYTNPSGSESYFDRCAVHRIVSNLQRQYPEWRNEDYLKYLRSVKVNRRNLPFEDKTIKAWISEIVPSKRGRPRGRKNTLKR